MSEWTPPDVVGIGFHEAEDAGTQALLTRLGMALRDKPEPMEWALEYVGCGGAGELTLIRPDRVRLQVDFTAGKTRHRTKESGQGAGMMRKALGIATFCKRHERFPNVLDTTGGWGQDAWAIASTGCTVTVMEQHPIVHALLSNGLSRALQDDESVSIAERIHLINADAKQILEQSRTAGSEMLDGSDVGTGTGINTNTNTNTNTDTDTDTDIDIDMSLNVDVIYMDPMYPSRARKKADSKKGMQFLHALLGPSDESLSTQLLAAALQTAATRVVVKRPKGAEPLPPPENWSGQKTTIESPNTRYDVYLNR